MALFQGTLRTSTSWTAINTGLPDVPVNAFVVDPVDSSHLYAGTDIGVYAVHRFLIDKKLTSATLALAKTTRCSPFMVLFSVFNLLLNKRTGVTDILVPTLTSGRTEPQFQETVRY